MPIRKFWETYAVQAGDFGAMCRELLNRIPAAKRVASLVVYGSPSGPEEYGIQRGILDALLCARYGDSVPPFSFIPQKPVTGGLVLEVCLFEADAGSVIACREYAGIRYMTIRNSDCRELITGGCVPAEMAGDTFEQASSVFRNISAIFSREGMQVNSIIRQWNYIGEITGDSGGMQHYLRFNLARSRFYDQALWENGYPAATATGMDLPAGAVIVRIEALEAPFATVTNLAINNSLQVAAHRYSAGVLAGNERALYAPRFERARLLGAGSHEVVLVSGTAAIRGEQSVAEKDVAEQTRITLENMMNLCTSQTEPVFGILVVYLKYARDYAAVKAVIDQSVRALSTVYVEAGMCREELLVEIEGVAG